MGITIQYRGTVDDMSRIEEMEDRVTDLVFACGGRATVWRSYAELDPARVVRGLIVEMSPGQETFSLLVSPEGHLTPLFQIEDAEKLPFDEPRYCFVKTQFGSLTGHVALVHLLDALKQRFISNLEVTDESDFYETRDFNQLKHKKEFLDGAIRSMADGLREHGLSHEAAEDSNIVVARIERIAILVKQKMDGDVDDAAEISQTGHESEAADKFDGSLEDEVAIMDSLRRKNDLRNERMHRRIAEATASGMGIEESLELAMTEERLGASSKNEFDESHDCADEESHDYLSIAQQEPQPDEPWRASLAETPLDESVRQSERDRHPTVLAAQKFMIQLMELEKHDLNPSSFFRIACQGAGDMVGGLVQATCDEMESRIDRALSITQLKRALTGHAYARGAIFGLSDCNAIDRPTADNLHAQLKSLLESIHKLMAEAWNEEGNL